MEQLRAFAEDSCRLNGVSLDNGEVVEWLRIRCGEEGEAKKFTPVAFVDAMKSRPELLAVLMARGGDSP